MKDTVKLYETDSHLSEFFASVISCEKNGEKYRVVLDKTAFFPEGGGQEADTGFIGDSAVFDVQISSGIITHITDKPLVEGQSYNCKLDFEKRFRRMQNHSGEHIVSGIIHRNFGFDNVGFHMGHEDVTLDVNGILSEDDIREIEILANKVVAENVRINCEYPDPEILKNLEYRSKLDLTENIRIVTIEGYDACACCAPHVGRTGEIGIIKLLDHERNKGGTRIHILCGFDALSDYDARYHMIAEAAKLLSIKQDKLGEALKRLEAEISDLKHKNYELRNALYEYKISEIKATDGNICIFEEDTSKSDMRRLMNICISRCQGICAVFCGDDTKGYTFVASSKNADLCALASDMREKLSAKGGGSAEMIQGSVKSTKEEIKKYFGV